MTRLSLRSTWARKRRLLGTFLAVFIGVSFLSGALVLGQTLQRNFDGLFADANAGTDAVVRSATKITRDGSFQRGPIDAATVDRIRDVEGVASVAPYVEGYGQLLGAGGEAIGGNGPPRLAASWIDDPDLNAYRLVEGRAPVAGGEVVVNRGAATSGDLRLGDTTTLQTPAPTRVRIVGIATFASADGLGQTTYAALSLAAAQRLVLGSAEAITSVRVKAEPGTTQRELVAALHEVLPAGTQAISGADLTAENTQDISDEFLGMLRMFLLVFSAIALLVGACSIYNTLSILTAQRTRESALMRALGASRGQILRSALIESLLVGAVASIAGLAGGIGISTLLKALFSAFGGALPDGGLVFSASTVITALTVGVLITALAGIGPARRAARVAPMAALGDSAAEVDGISPARIVGGASAAAIGVLCVILGALGGGGGAVTSVGAVLTLAGVIACGPLTARPTARLLGMPLARIGGIAGALARDNAMRNPRRTAATSAALMVGVAVVSLFTVFAGSLKSSIQDSTARGFGGDLAITTPGFGGGALNPRLATRVGRLPEIAGAVGLGQGAARVAGSSEQLTIADPPALARIADLDVRDGEIGGLGDDELAVSGSFAEAHGWRRGSRVPLTFADETRETLTIAVVYDNDEITGDVLISRDAWAPHGAQDLDTVVFMTVAEGVSEQAAVAAVRREARADASPDVQTRAQYIEASAGGIDALLGIVYVLLALAIVIALMGIANTLSLSIHERTRELGLLRAVGASRRQLRRMIRGESLIIAVLGTIVGLALGVFLGWGLVRSSADDASLSAFSPPVGQLLVVLVAGAAAGVLASLRPARGAARQDVLDAIRTR